MKTTRGLEWVGLAALVSALCLGCSAGTPPPAPDGGARDGGGGGSGDADGGGSADGGASGGGGGGSSADGGGGGGVDGGANDGGANDGGANDGGANDGGGDLPGPLTNLARGKPVLVSSETSVAPAVALVDGDEGTAWSADGGVPAWFKVDLVEPSTVESLRLVSAQAQAGEAVHHVRLLSELGNVLFEQTVTRAFTAGEALEVAFAAPVAHARFVQVYTQRGPGAVGWRELVATGRTMAPSQRRADVPRGLRWMREQPMFISALTVSLTPPGADVVNEYYDAFKANAVHLWETGAPNELSAWASAGRSDHRWLTWLLPDGRSRGNELFAGDMLPAQPGRIGYQVSDEPPGLEPLKEINGGIQRLRPFDPGALLVVNFPYDNDNIQTMFDYFCAQMDADVVSTDRYTYLVDKTHMVLGRFRELGLRCGRPYWRYLKAYHEDEADSIDPSDMRWDAFVGLVYGFTGHTWFLYQVQPSHGLIPALFTAPNDLRAPKTEYWQAAAQLNRELAALGRSVTQLTSTSVTYVPAVSLYMPRETTLWGRGAGDDPYLSRIGTGLLSMDVAVGHFKDTAGELYVMVQSQRHQHAIFPNQSKAAGAVVLEFDFSTAPAGVDRTALERLDQRTGQVVRVPLTDGAINLELPAGDVFFFKYATGAPFALQR